MDLKIFPAVLILLLTFITNPAAAQETSVMIRVKSKDAKFIGTSIGGARVVVRDELTGMILAEGITKGSTGNSELIMKTPLKRGQRLSDDATAGFTAVLQLEKPTFVTVEAFAPINKKQATVKATTQLWLIPGKDITGDGVVLEVPGFVVDILSPQTHERIGGQAEIRISANVVMMCGCPVTPEGLWDSESYEIKALVSKDGQQVRAVDMEFTGKESTFSSNISLPKGNYEIVVYAFDPLTGNTGLDKVNVLVN